MKKPKVKMLLKLTAAVLSVVMMLCALPLGALASEVRTAPTSLENGVTVEKPQSQKVYDGEMLSGVENIDTSLSETEPTSPLTELELSTIIKNGKMERISADNVPDAVGFESAKSKNHVARAFEKEKDELNSLVFLNEDGTYTKYLYDYPVKFVDESGSIKDISLDIVAEANGSYKRKQGGTSASFSEKVADGIKLSGDGASISLYPKIPTQVRQPVVTGEMGKLPLKSLLYSAENINSLDKKTVSYYYNDSTSLEYSLTYTGFKEDIVVSEYTGQTEYVFTLKTGGLTLTEDNGNFYLTDKNGNTKATLGQIIIFTADERNNTFGSMSAVAVKENEEYTVTIHVDAEYLKDEKTVYPIRIDPTIELTENGTSLVEDVVVNSNDTVSHRTTEALRVGKNEDGTYSRILIKFNYDFGSFADGPLKIHRAYVEMRDVMCQTESMTVMSEMYIGTNWSEDADWSAIARGVHTHYMASMPINYNKGNGYTEKHRYSISVLDAVKYWVAEANNTPDYYQASPQGGIMIKAYDAVEQGTTPIQKYFASSQYAETAYRPSLSVTYYDTHTQYSDPFGHLDAVTSNSIRGWVWCVDLPKQSVPVTIYLKNKTTGEDYPPINLSGKDTALYRPDVRDGDYGTGCYGFNYPVDWTKYSAGEYEVRAKWHSMNGTGLVYDLFNSPKGYVNHPFATDEYYINNKEHGRYLKSDVGIPGVESGLLADLGDKIKWKLVQTNNGYTIQDDQFRYLSVVSGAIELRHSASGLTTEHIWDMIYPDGGYCLKNRHSGKYLYTDGTQLLIDNGTGSVGSVQNREHVWRLVKTKDYKNVLGALYSEFNSAYTTAKMLRLGVGVTTNVSFEDVVNNVLWARGSDFKFIYSQNPNIARVSDVGSIFGVSVGSTKAVLLHKVTNTMLSVDVCVYQNSRKMKVVYDNSLFGYLYHQSVNQVNNLVDATIAYVVEQYAQLFDIGLVYDEPQMYTSLPDKCKVTVTKDNVLTECDQHSKLLAISEQLKSDIEVNEDEILVFISMHTILNDEMAENEYATPTHNRSCCIDNIIYCLRQERNIEKISDTLIHEVAHAFGALDHYHDVHTINNEQVCRNKNRCNKSTCNPNSIYTSPCLMGNGENKYDDDLEFCAQCKKDILFYFSQDNAGV